MYTKTVPCKKLDGTPANITVHFNLFEREVFKLLVEFKAIFEWQDRIESADIRELPTEDVVEFYNNLEEILLAAYGKPSADGLRFEKGERYEFEDSVAFNAIMTMFVNDPAEANKLIDGLMPKGLQKMIQNTDANIAALISSEDTPDEIRKKIEALQAQLPGSE